MNVLLKRISLHKPEFSYRQSDVSSENFNPEIVLRYILSCYYFILRLSNEGN